MIGYGAFLANIMTKALQQDPVRAVKLLLKMRSLAKTDRERVEK